MDYFDSLTRRSLMALGAGYALAVCPVTAWAVTTPPKGLDEGDVKIPVGKEMMPAYFAKPQKTGKHPCILVIHEIFGVHEYIRDVCRRLAHEGYAAISPYLYFREGDVSRITDIQQIIATVVSKVPQKQVLSDLDATLAWLAKQPDLDESRAGITGFCWGGNVTWMYASHNPKLKAGVAWYGKLDGERTPLQPKFPVDIAASLTVPVLGLYGGKDKGIPLKDVEAMREALQKGKSGSKFIVYPEAEHAFHADYRPSYNEQAAKAGWKELLGWFKTHGL